MPEPDDIKLLKQYAQGDESVFNVLFERYVNLVYSTALRQVPNPSHAEEITQAVFIILTRKAKSLGPKTLLSGWLYQTTRLTAANFMKREVRRQRREQEVYMQSTLTEPDTSPWEQISPLLDDAMGRLGEQDRNAIVLRFFENKTPHEVAATLNLNEVTARKRVSRALEKLRKFFTKRGVVSTTAVIAGAIAANSVQAAPATIAKSVVAVAIAKGAMASGSTLILVKGVLNAMTWTKVKIPLVIVAITVLATGLAFDPWKNAEKIYSETYNITADSLNKIKSYNKQAYQVASVITNANGTITTKYVVKDKAAKAAAEKEGRDSAERVMEIETNFFKTIPPGIIIRPHTQNPHGNTDIFKDENHEIGMCWTCQQLLTIAYSTGGRNLPLSRIIFPTNIPSGEFDYLINVPDHGKEKLQAEVQKYFGIIAHFEMIKTNALFLKIQNPNAQQLRNPTMPAPAAEGTLMFLDVDGIAYEMEEGLHQHVVGDTRLTQKYWINLPWPGEWDRAAVNSLKQSLTDDLGLEIIPTNMLVKMLIVEVTNEVHIPLPAETEMSGIKNLFKISDPWKDLDSVLSNYDRLVKSNIEKSRQTKADGKLLSNKELTDQYYKAEDVYNDYFSRIRTGVAIRPTEFSGPNTTRSLARGESQLIGANTSFLQLVAIAYGTDVRNYSTVRIILPTDSPKGNFDYCVNAEYFGRQSLREQIQKQFGLIGRVEMIKTNTLALKVKNSNAPSLEVPNKFPQTHTTVSYPLGTPEDMADIIYYLENEFFHEPIVDETQLTGQYWFYVPWDHKDLDLLRRIMMDHLGLELIPTNMPIEMLVIEKAE